MVTTFEQLRTKNLKTFDELRAKSERPDFGRILVPREELPGVWKYDKQLDQLLGNNEYELEDLVPLDVRFRFGQIVGMTEKPDRTKAKMGNSLYYSIIFDRPPEITFNLLDELNEIAFREPIDVEQAMKRYSDYYTGQKKYMTAVTDGLKNLGVKLLQVPVGAAKVEAEFGGKVRDWLWGNIFKREKPEYLKEMDKTLAEWSETMYEAIGEYYRENKDQMVQIVPGTGFRGTLFQYAKQPQAFVQSLVESMGMILEGVAGTLIGGPAGGIIAMGIPLSFETYPDVRAKGTEPLPALGQSIFTGMGEAAIEQWTLSKKLGLMKNFKKYVSQGLPKMLWEGVKVYFRGTAEEGTQEFNRNFWNWMFTDRSQQWKDNVAESMAIGGPMELAMAGAFSAVGAATGPQVAKEQKMLRIDQIQEAVESSPLSKEYKVEIIKELDTAREQIEVAEVSAEKRIQAINFVKDVLSQEQFAALDEKTRIEIGQRMLAEQGVEVTAEELAEIPPTVPIPAPEAAVEPRKPAEAVEIPQKPAEGRPTKITDRIDNLDGVEKTFWKEGELTVYYDEKIPKDTINLRVQKDLTDNRLLDSVKTIKLLSTEKGTFEPTPKPEPTKVKKPVEKPLQKLIKVEKKIIPKVSAEKFTPPEVQKETKVKVPDSDPETQNAANLLEGYWREHDERKLEIDVATTKNQEAITKALDKKQYLPESDIETSKMSQAMMLYIDLKEHPSGHQFAEELSKQQREIYELSKNLPTQVQKIADSIIKQNREFGALAIDKEIISIARENYIAHIWERPTRQESLQARFRQTTARAKARTLEGGIMEGWAKGKTLRVKDVTLATQIAQSQINQAIVGREMLKLGKKWGLLSHKQPADWVRVEHPGFTTWRWAGKAEKAKTYGRNFFVTEKGDLMERVPVYAEPELGKKLNKVFTPSALYKVPGIETISRYNAQIKTTILFTSLYHHQAFLRSYAFGSRGLNPKAAYEKGRQAIMNMTPEVRLLVRNGLTIGRIQDYDPRMIEGEQTIWGRALSHTKPTESARKKLVDLRKRQERFLFNKLGPALKIQAGILELKAELKRNQAELESGEITADEIAAAVANLINNDFGGLHLGRMGRSQTAQHIFRLLALAPDWTESNIRSAVDAFRKGETGYLHRMFWGRIAIKGLGATILFNLLLSAFDDDDFAERYKKAWETGRLRWLDIDITPIFRAMGGDDDKRKYFSLLGHFRDPVKFTVHPIVSAKHKGSVVSRVMMDMMIGEDWAGRKFTTIGELTGITEDGKNSGRLVKYGRGGARPIEPSQIPSYVLYEVRSAMPIPIQNIIAFLGGELDAFDAITKSAGLMTATTYPERKRKAKKITR